jgi:Ca2+-binding EF-hand superfamily protein
MAFKAADKNDDGEIDQEEFRQFEKDMVRLANERFKDGLEPLS